MTVAYKILAVLLLITFGLQGADCVYHIQSTDSTGTYHGTAFGLEVCNHRYIVTANHNIEYASQWFIDSRPLKKIIVDDQLDIVIMEFVNGSKPDCLKYDDSTLAVGDKVECIGFPEAHYLSSTGVIKEILKQSIFISADIQGVFLGSSGSPVLKNGKVIGILTAIEGKDKVGIKGKGLFLNVSRIIEMVLYDDFKKAKTQ